MAFDQTTRNRLANFVTRARVLLSDEFTRQLQHEYGLDPKTGEVTDQAKLGHLDDARRETATMLRETMEHYLAGSDAIGVKARKEVLDRIMREQAFTVLNRLCALRMAEARGLLIESVARDYQSKGFQLYGRLSGTALGERGDAYRAYLFSIFDEFAVDLPVLFDRFSPEGRLFPREATLLELLAEINRSDIDVLWSEDETIGWIYQYFNSKEERKAMRDASPAPRNSRELAVRNQFFTPRYVVEFLTDNTLGRIWYEMTGGETALKEECRYLVRRPSEVFLQPGEAAPDPQEQEDLSQEELLRQPMFIAHRTLKDPRDLKMIDPACGSMHFGLYAFDLFERIYAEAWEIEGSRGVDALLRPQALAPLHDTYADREAFLRDVPRLIIERNIHGIDIDPRAVQIAGLSLWLRAQRSWQRLGLKSQQRPRIERTNIVCAEPMPGEAALLAEFLQGYLSTTPDKAPLQHLVHRAFDAMKSAGEVGFLLKIEEEIGALVADAKKQWLATVEDEQGRLFSGEVEGTLMAGVNHGAPSLFDQRFWDEAEERVYAALRLYTEQAYDGDGFRKRLFATEVSEGFAFIDLCQKRYDVLLMNPPFGSGTEDTEDYLATRYPEWNSNLFCCFTARALQKADHVGAITDRAYMLKTSYATYRRQNFVSSGRCVAVVDLGWGVLDANVEVNMQVFSTRSETVAFANLMETGDLRAVKLRDICDRAEDWHFHVPSDFAALPDAILSYELPAWQLHAISEGQPIASCFAEAKSGLKPGRVEQFVRLSWEVPDSERGEGHVWEYFQNGGEYAPYYYPTHLVIRHDNGWGSIRAVPSSRITGIEDYGRPGITYGKRTDYIYGYPMPAGQVFSNEGMAVFPLSSEHRWHLLGFINAAAVQYLMNSLAGQHKAHSYFNKIYLPDVSSLPADVARYAREITQHLLWLAHQHEPSVSFRRPSFASVEGRSPREQFLAWKKELDWRTRKATELYRASSDVVSRWLTGSEYPLPRDEVSWDQVIWGEPGGEKSFAGMALSYLVGVAFGRWDVRRLSGSADPEAPEDPFQPLPSSSAAMLHDHDLSASPYASNRDSYPVQLVSRGIAEIGLGSDYGLVDRVRGVMRVLWNQQADIAEHEFGELLNIDSLESYLRNENRFFAEHLNRYSRGRRVAPIYWLIGPSSGAFNIWLYYHKLTDQTLYACINDFVEPKLKQVTEEVAGLRARLDRSAGEERELERLSNFETELKDFRDELLRIAKFWKPNLNDGVQITAAPLWKLFQHKAWQKKLKETWEKLEAGEYDWAHLAYSIWPERVREKCHTDKSLAIAHGLEDLYEEPKTTPKKKRVRRKQEEAEEELAELDLES